MYDVTDQLVLADVQRAIGYVLVVLLIGAFAVAVLINMRKGRAEVGSEIELAANRQPGMPDDELETKKLDRTLGAGLVVLSIIAVALPLYWLAEPGRQADAVEGFQDTFVKRGEEIYVEGAQCASCHGPEGVGGVASYTITDSSTGEFVSQVEWQAPALDTLMYRYTPEQVLFILNYGRGYSPMPAWGAPGGGPLTEQQLTDVIAYLTSIQLPAEESAAAVQEELDATCLADDEGNCTLPDAEFATEGEAIFNMGYTTKFAGGAYACGRCHTAGWSYGQAGPSGGGGMGPNMIGGSELRQFPTATEHEAFVSAYPDRGSAYGTSGQSSGRMGSFGVNPNAVDPATAIMAPEQVMLTPEQIAAVVAYERSL
jgi:mono/diheme cytochrome c family protein